MARFPLALHTWTLESTTLFDQLEIAPRTGWEALELRRVDFTRALERGKTAEDVIAAVRACGLPVAAVGVEPGWLFAEGAELRRLLSVFDEQCGHAEKLGAPIAMTAVGAETDNTSGLAQRVREVGDIARRHGLTVALEFNSQIKHINTIDRARDLLREANHPSVGLLVDTYHMQRSGSGDPSCYTAIPGSEIAYVQFSDVPAATTPGQILDRLPAGHGVIPFRAIFDAVAQTGYSGYLSYEAPNAEAWKRDADIVAREALDAARSFMS
ncbi:MAG: sugar phosphate isomerase/epimerase family protein [Chloroflexota bacterium]